MIRQGDILLIPAPDAPATHERNDADVVLGLGEVTGHSHVLHNAQWLVAPDTDVREFAATGASSAPVFVVAGEDATLTHEEHDTLTVPPGIWRVVRQREYSPQAIRAVMD